MGYKLDEAAKQTALTVIAVGGTMEMAAQMIGCTDRALYYAARQDLDFRKEIYKKRNSTEFICLRTMNAAAEDPKNWFAAHCLMKSLRPDRYARRANTVPVKQVKKLMKEFADGMCSAVTDQQSRKEIHRYVVSSMRSVGSGKSPKRRRQRPQKG